jgi:hypothetical protein
MTAREALDFFASLVPQQDRLPALSIVLSIVKTRKGGNEETS